MVASVSPPPWWNEKEMIAAITAEPAWLKDTRVWLDMGTAEDNPTTDGRVGKNLAATGELAAFVDSLISRTDGFITMKSKGRITASRPGASG